MGGSVRQKNFGSWRLGLHCGMGHDVSFLGRGVDLSEAYKQVAVHPDSQRHSVVAVRREDGTWSFFLSHALPFGAAAFVFAFNKLTRGLWCILVWKFRL